MLPTKFRVKWPFSSGEEGKNRFSRWSAWLQSWISDQNNFSNGLSVQEKKRKIDFQDGHHGGHFGFPIRMILAIFYLQVNLMLPTKFQVKWPFSSGEEAKNRFFKMAANAAILDFRSKQFYLFLIYTSPRCLLPSFKSTGLTVQEKKQKMDSQDGCHGAILDFRLERF